MALRLSLVLCLIAVAQGRRTKPRSTEVKATKSVNPDSESVPSPSDAEDLFAAHEAEQQNEVAAKDEPAEKENEEPEYYDPTKAGTCPTISPQLEDTNGAQHAHGQVIPSMVKVTIYNAQHLPWSYFDYTDPHVEFWTGEEGRRHYHITKKLLSDAQSYETYWRARTPALSNTSHPLWDWSCLMTYDAGNPIITFQVWDRDLTTNNDFIGKASGNIIEMFQNEDDRGTGEIEVKFLIKDHKGEQVRDRAGSVLGMSSPGKAATLTVRMRMVNEPAMYEVNRKEGYHKANIHPAAY